jgi:sulfotransferase family protein
MFPEARFVFSLRGPWQTIQSAIRKGKTSFILRTKFVNSLPDDLILRAAAGWAEGIDVLKREHDHSWIPVRYEDLVASPKEVVSKLYADLGIDDSAAADRASALPERRQHDYSFINGQLVTTPHRWKIFNLVLPRAWSVGYTGLPPSLRGTGLRYVMADRSAKHRSRPKHIANERMNPIRGEQSDVVELPGFLPTISGPHTDFIFRLSHLAAYHRLLFSTRIGHRKVPKATGPEIAYAERLNTLIMIVSGACWCFVDPHPG